MTTHDPDLMSDVWSCVNQISQATHHTPVGGDIHDLSISPEFCKVQSVLHRSVTRVAVFQTCPFHYLGCVRGLAQRDLPLILLYLDPEVVTDVGIILCILEISTT